VLTLLDLVICSGFFHFGLFGMLLMAAALNPFRARQPDSYWLWIILLLGPIGSLSTGGAGPSELRDPGTFNFMSRNRRIRELEFAVSENPSAGNYEELGQLYLDKGQWEKARALLRPVDHPTCRQIRLSWRAPSP